MLACVLAWAAGCSEPEQPARYDTVQVSDVAWRLDDRIASIVVVSWTQDVAATAYLEFRTDDGPWRTSRRRTVDPGPATELLLGVPFDVDLTFRVVNDFGDGPLATEEIAATTGHQPDGLPEPSLLRKDPTRWEPSGRFLLGSIAEAEGTWDPGTYWRFILDRQGRYVWAQQVPDEHWSIYVQVSRDGRDILWDDATYWKEIVDMGPDGRVLRTKIDGTVVETYPTPHLQHAFVELPDGSIVWGASLAVEDRLMRVSADGTEEQLWSCLEYLDDIDYGEYCIHNGLFYDEDRDSFLFSFYSLDTVFEIDRATGEVVRSFGQVPGSWDFDPPESTFWTQHGPSYTTAGTLLVSSQRSADDEEGVVREYALDDDERALRQVWSFGEGEGIEMPSAGEAHRLAHGNTLHNMGSAARVREITPDGAVVWDVAWESPRLLGRTLLVDDLYAFAP